MEILFYFPTKTDQYLFFSNEEKKFYSEKFNIQQSICCGGFNNADRIECKDVKNQNFVFLSKK